jgi:hypothetical protein
VTRNNVLYLIFGALVIAVAALGYELYQARKAPPEGVHIDIGPKGLSIGRNSEHSSFAVTSFEPARQVSPPNDAARSRPASRPCS